MRTGTFRGHFRAAVTVLLLLLTVGIGSVSIVMDLAQHLDAHQTHIADAGSQPDNAPVQDHSSDARLSHHCMASHLCFTGAEYRHDCAARACDLPQMDRAPTLIGRYDSPHLQPPTT